MHTECEIKYSNLWAQNNKCVWMWHHMNVYIYDGRDMCSWYVYNKYNKNKRKAGNNDTHMLYINVTHISIHSKSNFSFYQIASYGDFTSSLGAVSNGKCIIYMWGWVHVWMFKFHFPNKLFMIARAIFTISHVNRLHWIVKNSWRKSDLFGILTWLCEIKGGSLHELKRKSEIVISAGKNSFFILPYQIDLSNFSCNIVVVKWIADLCSICFIWIYLNIIDHFKAHPSHWNKNTIIKKVFKKLINLWNDLALK